MSAETKKLHCPKRTTSPTPTVTPQGTTGATNYSYKLVAKDSDGQVAAAGTAGATTTGNAVLDGTNFNRVTWVDSAGAASFDVYRTVGGATQGKIGTVAAGVQTFDDTGLVANGATAPVVNVSGTGRAQSVAHYLAGTIQCSGAGGAFVGTIQVKGSLDGVEFENVGAAFTAGGFADLARRYAVLRADMTAYTSGDPAIWVHGVSGAGE
jgi:hypothetical protein